MRFKTQPSDVFLNFFIRYGSSNSVQVSQSLKNRLDVLYKKIELQQQTSRILFRLLIGCIIFILVSFSANAQVGIGTTSPKATLDIEASNRVNPGPDEGLLIPRIDSMPVINPGADQEGMLVYLTTTSGGNSPGLYVWNNIATSWINIDKAITTLISDADSDTKIQVEKNADEDIIRFNIAGAEQFRMEGPRLEMNGSGRSIFIGNDAGLNDDLSDNKNVFIGNLAGQSNTTGSANLGIGFESLTNSITATQNIAIGNNSQSARTTGDNNTSLGFIALQSNRGSRNVSIGAGSLLANTTGNNNVAIGTNTGASATGDNNVFLGYRAGENETGSNKLIIENSASLSPLLYGEFNNNLLRVNGELQIGTAFTFPTADGTANQVLSTDGTGNVSWSSQTLLQDTDTDTKIQVEKNTDEDIIRFDLAGLEKWTMTGNRLEAKNTGNSVFIGTNAGLQDDITNNSNVFIGLAAGRENISGNQNLALSQAALLKNTTGSLNIALGFESLKESISGDGNLAIGHRALSNKVSGNNNVALGKNAGVNNISGSRNLFIGNDAGANEIGSDKLYIDNTSTTTPLIYGEFDTNSLRVNGELQIGTAFVFPTIDGTANQILSTNGAGTVSWQNAITDTDNQTVDKLNLNGTTLELSLEDDGAVDYTVDLSSLAATSNLIQDTDGDTQIQVEKNADDDVIRFDVAGIEYFRMNGHRLDVVNSGNSVFLGNRAGQNDDLTSNSNVFIGEQTGRENITGQFNVSIGQAALFRNVNGNRNTAIGFESLRSNVASSSNSAFGFRALANNISGAENIAMGNETLFRILSGNRNVALGNRAGFNSIGNRNIFIGYAAGSNELNDDKLYIANTNTTTPLIYGEFDNNILRINGELQVGTAFAFPTIDGAANQVLSTDGAGTVTWQNAAIDTDNQTVDKLNLNGTTLELSLEDDGAADYTVDLNSLATATNTLLVDADGDTKVDVEETADEDILRFDLAGTEYFTMNAGRLNVENTGFSVFIGRNAGLNDDLANRNNVFVGDVSGTTNTTGIFNVGVGSRTLRDNTTGQYNVAIGGQALIANSTGNQNTAVGMEAMFTNTTGANNVAIGRNALHQNTGGSDNVAVGYEALDANTTGTINNAFGSGALTENTTGIHNAAFGYNAMQDNTVGTRNAAFGNNSLRNNTTGSFNTALGYIALDNNLTGQDNVAVGYNAGKNSTGSDNIYVGTQAGINQTAGDNNIVIGTDVNLASVTGSNQLNIGDILEGDLSTGAVSINSNFNVLANGSLLMQANGGTNPVGITQNSNVGGASTLELTSMDGSSNQATRLLFRGNNNNADIEFYRGASGSESKTMHIEGSNGNVGIGTGTPNYLLEVNGTAAKPGGGAWTATSDKRLKENIKPYEDGLELILNIAPVRYHYNAKSGYDTKQEHIGVIAQDLKKVAPYMVFDFNKDNTSYLNVDNSSMTYALINSVKSQNEIITSQQAEIDALKMRIQKSEETNNATKSDMETLKTELLQIKAALKAN